MIVAPLAPEVAAAVERSAVPRAVGVAIDRLVDDQPAVADRLAVDRPLREALIAVLGASRALTQVLMTDPAAIEVLAAPDMPVAADDVARWQRLEYLRIAARDLTGRDSLEEVGAALSDMADGVFRRALEIVGDGVLAVIAMGKYGGRELNYASDVDVMFVGSADARPLLDVARECFRVDVDLRPEGRNGPLVRTLDAYRAYWERWAQTWEFQALLKQRPAAGALDLGNAFATAAQRALWSRPFGAEELREVRAMKGRAEGEMLRRGLADRELKRGRGGIRDIEFAVQLLQLVHGHTDATLRSPTTLQALSELASAGYVAPDDAAVLADAYRFLRTVEHRLQLWDGAQVHAIPERGESLERLARVCGYRGTGERDAVAAFMADLRQHQSAARSIHERLFFRPLLESFSGVSELTAAMPEAAIAERLSAFGFASAARTRQALTELTRGLTRSSRLMQQMLPLLLGWLSESPDPEDGLLGLRGLAGSPHRADQLAQMFRDSPEGARRLCVLLGSSRLVATGLQRHPELVADLAEPERLAVPALDLDRAVRWRPAGPRVEAFRRLNHYEELRIQMRDLLGAPDPVDVALTTLAEATLTEALSIARSMTDVDLPVAVVAMGRFGGGELSYASDLDVMMVYEGNTDADAAAAAVLVSAFRVLVNGPTPAQRLYRLDFDLRPEGRQGPLARSLEGYRQYYERWAQTWERQALLRGRVAVGSPEVGAQFADIAREFLARPVTDDDEREIRRMKARIERERIPPGDDPDFHLKLGRGGLADVEWTVQLLQLRHQVLGAAGTMEALRRLVEGGRVSAEDAAALQAAYVYCERTRNRLYLVRGAPGDALPTRPEQLGKLARSLDTTGPALRTEYLRVTRRAREVTERLFYDRPAR